MFYLVLLAVVILGLSVVAWRFPSHRKVLAPIAAAPAAVAAPGSPGEIFARLAKGQRKIDEPCLTPIDCVLDDRCDGHCGCH